MSISISPFNTGGNFYMNNAISGNDNVAYLMVLPSNNDSITGNFNSIHDSSNSSIVGNGNSISLLQNLCNGCSINGNNDSIHSSGSNDHIYGNNMSINGGSNITRYMLQNLFMR